MTIAEDLTIRDARTAEFVPLGRLLVSAYSQLEGFPGPAEQPQYYEMLAHVGAFAERPGVRLLVAIAGGELIGGAVYFADMAEYASGGTATSVRNASGMRLLAVSVEHRGVGAGKALTCACIDATRAQRHEEMILHTTAPMRVAWRMYTRLGFRRAADLDFMQQGLPVFGFRLRLTPLQDARPRLTRGEANLRGGNVVSALSDQRAPGGTSAIAHIYMCANGSHVANGGYSRRGGR